jgi:hypothetical protein
MNRDSYVQTTVILEMDFVRRCVGVRVDGGFSGRSQRRPGQGANFTLHLPVQPESITQVLEK